MFKPMGIRRFLATIVTVFLLAYATVVALPHDPYMRYQSFNDTIFNRLSWIYSRLVHDDTPIDVLVVGSSRSELWVNTALVEDALAERNRDLRVANIAIASSGLDARLSEVRLALETHPEIKLVIFGVVEQLDRDGHQAFSDLGSVGEILTQPWMINRNLPETLAKLPYRQLELSLATLVPDAFGYASDFDPDTYAGTTPDRVPTDDPDGTIAAARHKVQTPEHREILEEQAAQRRRGISPPILPGALSWAEFGVSRHYVRELVEMTEENGTKLAFLFIPFYTGYDAPLDVDWLTQFGPIWSPLFVKSNPINYADSAHASLYGRELLAPWLAEQIDSAGVE